MLWNLKEYSILIIIQKYALNEHGIQLELINQINLALLKQYF